MDWKYENGRIYGVDENNELIAETTFVFKENGRSILIILMSTPLKRKGDSRQNDGSCC